MNPFAPKFIQNKLNNNSFSGEFNAFSFQVFISNTDVAPIVIENISEKICKKGGVINTFSNNIFDAIFFEDYASLSAAAATYKTLLNYKNESYFKIMLTAQKFSYKIFNQSKTKFYKIEKQTQKALNFESISKWHIAVEDEVLANFSQANLEKYAIKVTQLENYHKLTGIKSKKYDDDYEVGQATDFDIPKNLFEKQSFNVACVMPNGLDEEFIYSSSFSNGGYVLSNTIKGAFRYIVCSFANVNNACNFALKNCKKNIGIGFDAVNNTAINAFCVSLAYTKANQAIVLAEESFNLNCGCRCSQIIKNLIQDSYEFENNELTKQKPDEFELTRQSAYNLFYENKVTDALKIIFKALYKQQEIKQHGKIATCYSDIALFYAVLKKPDKAKVYLNNYNHEKKMVSIEDENIYCTQAILNYDAEENFTKALKANPEKKLLKGIKLYYADFLLSKNLTQKAKQLIDFDTPEKVFSTLYNNVKGKMA